MLRRDKMTYDLETMYSVFQDILTTYYLNKR
jgi:hypothetical protein